MLGRLLFFSGSFNPFGHGKSGKLIQSVSATNFPKLSTCIHEMSCYVFANIFESFAGVAFSPGYVLPDQTPNENGEFIFHGKTYRNPDLHAFLALDRTLLRKYQRAYWESNTWVIVTGPYDLTLGFLNRMDDDGMRIESVHLSFTTDDLADASKLLSWTQAQMIYENGGQSLSMSTSSSDTRIAATPAVVS